MKPLNADRLYFGSQFQTCLVHHGGKGKVELLLLVMAGGDEAVTLHAVVDEEAETD